MKNTPKPLTEEEKKTAPLREALQIARKLEEQEEKGTLPASGQLQLAAIRENLHI
jgi:hypothetical protein